MNGKRIVSAALALLLTAGIPMAALAEEYDLANGNITVSADNSGQYVSQEGGVANEKQTTETVIKQADNTAATGNTITVKTSGGAKAELTIEDLNVRSGNTSAIDVKGSSEAEITLKGDNKLETDDASVIHVSEGHLTITGDGTLYADNDSDSDHAKIGSNGSEDTSDSEDMSGSIHITGNAQVTTGDDRHDHGVGGGAAIGSGRRGNMSGGITIDENATVIASSSEDGAGIGSGLRGDMSGTITIGGNATVTGTSGYDGAGIGSGENGTMSRTITIDGNAKVTAWSEEEGAGIGAGEDSGVSGTIRIGGNASVKAGSACDGAGIGGGGDEDGDILESGKIIICGNAEVIAIGEDLGCGIGGGEDADMKGMILICDNANVTAIGGDRAAAIGADDAGHLSGSILILGNASVTTGVEDGIHFDYDKKQIIYTLDESAVGIIGDGQSNHHDSTDGFYILGPDVSINGLKGSDTESLKQYINLLLSGENHDGEPENLTMLAVRQENGVYTVETSGQGTLEQVLYNGSSQAPSAPGRYTVKCVLRLSQDKTIDFEFELIIPDSASKEASEAARTEALFRVTDADGRDIPYTQAREGSTLTIAAEQDFAILTGTLHGIAVLQAQGVEKIVFKTNGASSSFQPEQLLAEGRISDRYTLTHDGSTVTFLLGQQKTDIQKLLG